MLYKHLAFSKSFAIIVRYLKQGTIHYAYIFAEVSREVKQNDCVTSIFTLLSGRKEGRSECSGTLKAEAGESG